MRTLRRLLAGWVAMWVTAAVAGAIAKFTVHSEDDPAAERFALLSIFEGTEFRPTTRNLGPSRALTMFGRTRIDLRRAASSSPIRLELTTVMGGTDITVPDSWRVTVEGFAVFGGHDVTVTDPDTLAADATHLVIAARTVIGGVRVQSRPVLASASATA